MTNKDASVTLQEWGFSRYRRFDAGNSGGSSLLCHLPFRDELRGSLNREVWKSHSNTGYELD